MIYEQTTPEFEKLKGNNDNSILVELDENGDYINKEYNINVTVSSEDTGALHDAKMRKDYDKRMYNDEKQSYNNYISRGGTSQKKHRNLK